VPGAACNRWTRTDGSRLGRARKARCALSRTRSSYLHRVPPPTGACSRPTHARVSSPPCPKHHGSWLCEQILGVEELYRDLKLDGFPVCEFVERHSPLVGWHGELVKGQKRDIWDREPYRSRATLTTPRRKQKMAQPPRAAGDSNASGQERDTASRSSEFPRRHNLRAPAVDDAA
jgi:hypothetical protein